MLHSLLQRMQAAQKTGEEGASPREQPLA